VDVNWNELTQIECSGSGSLCWNFGFSDHRFIIIIIIIIIVVVAIIIIIIIIIAVIVVDGLIDVVIRTKWLHGT